MKLRHPKRKKPNLSDQSTSIAKEETYMNPEIIILSKILLLVNLLKI